MRNRSHRNVRHPHSLVVTRPRHHAGGRNEIVPSVLLDPPHPTTAASKLAERNVPHFSP